MRAFLRSLWKGRERETKTLALPIREFVYFDRQKVEDFVSALLTGLPVERTEGATTRPPEVSGNIGYAGTGISLKKGSRELSREELLKATDASLFERLHQILERERVVISEDIGMPLEVGKFVEVKAGIEFSALERFFDLVKWFKNFEAVTPAVPVRSHKKETEWKLLIKYLDMLSGERETYNIRIKPLTEPFKKDIFVASLSKANVRVAKGELAGEYVFFGRVQRKLALGEKFPLFRLFPEGIQLPEQDMGDFLDAFKDMPPLLGPPVRKEDLQVSYPALVLTPVAIFR
jgi:hypothetical protein